jgi:hypothetical protein
MISNLTKDKGDIGLISVILDLQKKGVKSCLPIAEHLPFDLIAVSETGKLLRVSVKYVRMKRKGISVRLKSVYSNLKGRFDKTVDFNLIDCIAVFCPDTEICYYIGVENLKPRKSVFTLRHKSDVIKFGKPINFAENFYNIEKLWK